MHASLVINIDSGHAMDDMHITRDLFLSGLRELPEGARHVMRQSVVCYTQQRMQLLDVLALLRSFAWQSATLRAYFSTLNADIHQEFDVLSEDDMRELMRGVAGDSE